MNNYFKSAYIFFIQLFLTSSVLAQPLVNVSGEPVPTDRPLVVSTVAEWSADSAGVAAFSGYGEGPALINSLAFTSSKNFKRVRRLASLKDLASRKYSEMLLQSESKLGAKRVVVVGQYADSSDTEGSIVVDLTNGRANISPRRIGRGLGKVIQEGSLIDVVVCFSCEDNIPESLLAGFKESGVKNVKMRVFTEVIEFEHNNFFGQTDFDAKGVKAVAFSMPTEDFINGKALPASAGEYVKGFELRDGEIVVEEDDSVTAAWAVDESACH